MSSWYKYTEGKLYLHTNYQSFQSNVGSFGGALDTDADIKGRMETAITKQEKREKELEKIIKKVFGNQATLKNLQKHIQEYLDIMAGKIVGKWIEQTITTPQGDEVATSNFLINNNINDALRDFNDWKKAHGNVEIITSLVENVTKSVDYATADSKITLERWQETEKRIDNNVQGIKTRAKEDGNDSILTKVSTQALNNLKGSLFELYGAKFLIAALQAMGSADKDVQVVLQGSKNVSDIRVDLSGFSFGISMKASELKSFAGSFGLRLFSSDFNNVFKQIEQLGKNIDYLKYYTINMVRAKAQPMVDQSGSTSIQNLDVINDLLRSYATIYLGSQDSTLSSDDAALANEFRQSDLFFTQEKIYLKSEILREISQDKMRVFLQLDAKNNYDYLLFDHIKRSQMFFLTKFKGLSQQDAYATVERQAFMSNAISATLKVKAAVRIRLLGK